MGKEKPPHCWGTADICLGSLIGHAFPPSPKHTPGSHSLRTAASQPDGTRGPTDGRSQDVESGSWDARELPAVTVLSFLSLKTQTAWLGCRLRLRSLPPGLFFL